MDRELKFSEIGLNFFMLFSIIKSSNNQRNVIYRVLSIYI